MHQCWMHISDTDGHTDKQNTLVVNWRGRRKENESIVDRHTDKKLCRYHNEVKKNIVYELLKLTNRKMTTVRTNT